MDHQERDGLEHKVERILVRGEGAAPAGSNPLLSAANSNSNSGSNGTGRVALASSEIDEA